ncbi:cytochrome P450 [Ephemerocybe angulata]|uniref:Cytochrome P450 n=1 Tax=Ephemerocybe angulata TaxID=980116 RepID=A0A8H6I6W3_9AGAR|nr:cytochrome P450 [Tulosesus angulatus]
MAFLQQNLKAHSLLHALTLLAFYQLSRWLYRSMVVCPPFIGIPGPKPASWFSGNLGQLFNAKGLPFHQHLSDFYGGMVKVYGFFGDEQLYISDPLAIQAILGKEQECFDETAVFLEANKIIFGSGLVSTTGELHKRQRKLAAPMFSTAQLAKIAPTFYDIAEKLVDVLQREVNEQLSLTSSANAEEKNDGKGGERAVLDMSEWSCRVSLEAAGRAILGYSFDPLDSPVSNPYTTAIKELIPTLFSLALVRQFAPFFSKLGPAWFRRKLVEWTPNRKVQKVKATSDLMHESAKAILEERRAQLLDEADLGSEDGGRAKDLISMLCEYKRMRGAAPEERMDDDELTGQMTVLIFGAQDTTSSVMSRVFSLLATHPDVQLNVLEEIRNAYALMRQHDADGTDCAGGRERLDQETLMGLPWLDAVMKETLRLYPPVPFVRRTCTKEASIPYTRTIPDNSNTPFTSLASVRIPKGTTLFLSIAGCNRIRSLWGDDAGEWKPERWLESTQPYSKDVKIPGAHSGMLSFLGGGRSCIGYRFAMLEMKIILATVLSSLVFSPTEDRIVWNLAQITSPSVCRAVEREGRVLVEETKALPLFAAFDDALG